MQKSSNKKEQPGTWRITKLFRNNKNQAIRLPKEYEIDAEEVYIRKEGNHIILIPKPRTWEEYFANSHRLLDDFPEDIEDLPLDSSEDL